MLSGRGIIEAYENGRVIIEPYDITNINPNSYNCHIGNSLMVYDLCDNICNEDCPSFVKSSGEGGYFGTGCKANKISYLDPKKNNPTITIPIPEEGYILEPGVLYLAQTIERTESLDYIVCLDGRSSSARLGVGAHITAGFGDYGYKGVWTLEITVEHPCKIYPGMSICQFYFESIEGDKDIVYQGKYNNSEGISASKYYTENV